MVALLHRVVDLSIISSNSSLRVGSPKDSDGTKIVAKRKASRMEQKSSKSIKVL